MDRSFLFIVVLAAASPSLAARDLIVSPEEGPYKTILEAIEDSKEGDSIIIRAGKYLETKTLLVEHCLRFIGDDPSKVQVFGPAGEKATFAVVGARAVHFDSLGIGAPTTSGAGAILVDGGSVTITHCAVRVGAEGIVLGPAKEVPASVIVNCVLDGRGEETTALQAEECPAPLLRNNIFYRVKKALSLDEVEAQIEYNDFYQCADITKEIPGNYLDLDPTFVSANLWDYRLGKDSKCFDKGHPSEAYKDALPDHGGTERCDLGAYGGAIYSLFPPYILSKYTVSASPLSGPAPLEVDFTVTFTERGDGDLYLQWVFGDGDISAEETPSHSYEAGTWTAFLVVEQSVGVSSTSEAIKIEVSQGPNRAPVCSFEADPGSGEGFAPVSVRFEFTGDDPDLNLESIAWEIDGEPVIIEGEDYGDEGALLARIADAGPHEVRCTARDAGGLESTCTKTYFARWPEIIDLLPHPVPLAIESGTHMEVCVRGKPRAYAVVFYGKEPLTGAMYDGTPIGLGPDYRIYNDVVGDGIPMPVVLDDTGHAWIGKHIIDLPGRYFFQVMIASDEKMETDRVLSVVSADEKRYYLDLLPAACKPDRDCYSGRLYLKKPVEFSLYDTDPETPGLQPKPGFELRPDGRYAIRFETVPMANVLAQVVRRGDEEAVTSAFFVGEDGYFEAPALPDVVHASDVYVCVISQSRHSRVVTGPLFFSGYADTMPYEAAWEIGNLDTFLSRNPFPGGTWGMSFVDWLTLEKRHPLEEEKAAAEARIADARARYESAYEDLELAQRRLGEGFDRAISESMGALGVALSTLNDLLLDLARLGECFTTCKWWEWLIFACPTRCIISFTIDLINTAIDTVRATVRAIHRCIEFLTTGIAFNNPDYFSENLEELERIRDEAWASVHEAEADLEEEEGELDEIMDLLAFLDRFIDWVEGLPEGCSNSCEHLLHHMVAHRGGEFFPLYLDDERFDRIFHWPNRTFESAVLRRHPGFLLLGRTFSFGDIVIDPEADVMEEDEYRKAYQFCNIIERVERSFDFVFTNSPAYRAETSDERDDWRHIIDVIYPSLAGPRSFYWGRDFDDNDLPDLALAPGEALDDTVIREYGRHIMDAMLRIAPLPVPGTAEDYTRFPVSCFDEGRSPAGSYAEGWSRFFVEAVAPAPGNIAEPHLEFLDDPGQPCRFREGQREESWTARIFWELFKEKPAPVLPGNDPGLYSFDDLAAAIAGPGGGPPMDICAYRDSLTALYGGNGRVDLIYRRNMVATSQDGRCGEEPTDRDLDGIPDRDDNCLFVANHDQADFDGDTVGDACDDCDLYNPDQMDRDYDGTGDLCEGPPVLSITATPSSGSVPFDVTLSGSAADSGGSIVSWSWEVDGAAAGTGRTITVTITSVGSHPVVLRAVDDEDREGVAETTVTGSLSLPLGDVTGDKKLDITDSVSLLGFLFMGGGPPACQPVAACADINADGKVDLSDPIHLLTFLFLGGPPPGQKG